MEVCHITRASAVYILKACMHCTVRPHTLFADNYQKMYVGCSTIGNLLEMEHTDCRNLSLYKYNYHQVLASPFRQRKRVP